LGILKYPNKTYEGQWHNNLPNGVGKVTLANGSYCGNFLDGSWHGYGFFRWNDGQIYIGAFENGQQHGYGELFFADGICSYKGEFRNNRPHGKGKIVYASRRFYIGEMCEGERHGFGKLFDENGNIYFKGNFSKGCIVGYGTWYKAGEKIKGNFKNLN
jgi:hypothetical protein